jgi:hypothetical protein
MKRFLIGSLMAAASMAAAPATIDTPGAGAETRVINLVRNGSNGKFEFYASVLFSNTTGKPARFEIEFFDEHGKPLEFPFKAADGKVVWLSRQAKDLNPWEANGFISTHEVEGFQYGWMRVRSTPGAVRLEVLSWYRKLKEEEFRNYSLTPVAAARWQMLTPYLVEDDILLVNDTAAEQAVQLIARGEDGGEMCRASVTLKPSGMYASGVAKTLACAATKPGSIEVAASGDGIAAVLFRFASGKITPIYPSGAASPASGGIETGTLEDKLKDVLDIIRRLPSQQ